MNKQTIRIVIAEDDFLVAEEIKRILHVLGYTVIGEASNGEEAVRLASELNPDVILMDIKMPKMDGLEASLQIGEKFPLPIVMLTAYESIEFVDQASKAGVGSFLCKPPNPAELDRAIRISMARHSDLMELRRLNNELTDALEEVKTLKTVLPICCVCGIIRDDSECEPGKGEWMKMDRYLTEKANAQITHTYCPGCYLDAKNQYQSE